MLRLTSRTKVAVRVSALAVAGALALASCAEDSSTGSPNSGDGEGVEFGASMEDYQAAFEDVDPIELSTQTPAPQGSVTGRRFENYVAAVEEWSGGKITFDIQYANAVAGPTEIDNALNDGRLDIGSTLPLYEPAEYPASDALVSATIVGPQTPIVGFMALHGTLIQVGVNTDEIYQEFEDAGMHMLFPAFTSGASALMCGGEARTSLDDLAGAQISAGSKTLTAQVSELGATPVTVDFTELFESLQRGAVDCAGSSLLVGSLGGFLPAAQHVVLDPEVGLGQAPGAYAMSLDTWESLPLVAQQLIHDRLDGFLNDTFHSTWESIQVASAEIGDADGEIQPLEADARAELQTINDGLLEELRDTSAVADGSAFVDLILESNENWVGVAEELGYTDEVDYNGFAEWYSEDKVDVSAYVERLFADALNERRPG